ncbi:hypothetical protein IWW36_003407, partial [Coemansia brasiliensis]
LASGMFGNKSEHKQSSPGFDFGQIASMASGFVSNSSNESEHENNELISSALKMGTSSGFNQGHQASHDDMKSSYLNIFSGGGSSGGGQDQLVSMAIAEAKKLFGQHSQGGNADEKATLATAARQQ